MTISYYREPLTQNFMGSLSFVPLVHKMIFAFAKKNVPSYYKRCKSNTSYYSNEGPESGTGQMVYLPGFV